jgi:hypothetical protein
MNDEQAQDVIASVEQLWECKVADNVQATWKTGLYPYEAIDAAAAVIRIRAQTHARPTLEDVLLELEDIVARKRVGKPLKSPEWVSVWFWMRFKQGNHKMLPQQDPDLMLSDMGLVLTKDEYEDVRQQWIADGSPVASIDGMVRVMTGAR